MDTTLSADDLAFRDEVRAFLAEAYNDDLKERLANKATYKDAQIEWQRKLNDKGWVAPNWPTQYGGAGWTPTQNYIYENERSLAGAPDTIPFGLSMVAPVIYGFGSEEQKQKFLPRILKSEDWWCQGYSEPGSGSDLASLKTKAELDGDEYVVNGAKIWTTYAQYADWIFCLVRTDSSGKNQDGITFLLIDMNTPGIKVNPIIGIDNRHTLNEVEFNNVRVPVANRIGEQDKGWTYAKALLQHERTAIAGVAESKRQIRELKATAAEVMSGGKPILEDSAFRKNITDIEIELMALEYTELRVLAATASGSAPGAESSLLKIKGTEIQQSIQKMWMDLSGYHMGAQALQGEEDLSGHGFANNARIGYMYGRAATVYGGSNEVQKNIISKFVLGL
jgi:alkylation response protein AidB-like acyl-CoA dehydrogenase